MGYVKLSPMDKTDKQEMVITCDKCGKQDVFDQRPVFKYCWADGDGNWFFMDCNSCVPMFTGHTNIQYN
jgi:hypothetical protein